MWLSKKDERDIRKVWGHAFEWTPDHQTKEQMRPLAFTYDVLGSECLDRLDELSPPPSRPPPNPDKPSAHPRRDLYALLSDHHAADPKLAALWTQLHTVPDWVDWAQIARGQDVFARYGVPAIVALTFQSLVGGMAGRRVVETLARTGGFGVAVARRRLLETFQHVLQVTRDLDSIRPGGDGFASSVRVRLLHAHVRRRILALSRADPGYFDVAAWGVPVNDLDCLGTVLSFSAALVWLGLPRQGIRLREQEVADYHALWRWVAHLLGTPAEGPWLADWRRSKALLESLMVAELEPSETSRTLANNTITALSRQPPTYTSREFMCAEAHWLIGRDLSDALGIARPSLWHRALVASQCLYFMCMCYVYRSIPSWDREKNERVRRFFYRMTVQNETVGLGKETVFEFKYVPQLGLTTSPGEPGHTRPVESASSSGPQKLGLGLGLGLVGLMIRTALVGTVVLVGLRSVTRLAAGLW